MRLSQIYRAAGYEQYADRAGACATWLQFNVLLTDGGVKRSLRAANFCDLRLCPMCTARRARRAALKLSQVMDSVENEQQCRYLFLTLTLANCDGDALGCSLSLLTRGWARLMDRRDVVRAVGGWFRAIEITRNHRTGQYHPHLHAILAVPCAYFGKGSGLYISHDRWVDYWQQSVGVDYHPSVRISTTRGHSDGRSAALEAAKYVTKDSDYISDKLANDAAAQIVRDYTRALFRRRLTAYGGWLKAASIVYDADLEAGDLIHVDSDSAIIRNDLADMIETYNWSLGAGDYILAERVVNPLKIIPAEKAEALESMALPDQGDMARLALELRRQDAISDMRACGLSDADIYDELRY